MNIKEILHHLFGWLPEWKDPLHLVKKNKPKGKPNAGWIDNKEWLE